MSPLRGFCVRCDLGFTDIPALTGLFKKDYEQKL